MPPTASTLLLFPPEGSYWDAVIGIGIAVCIGVTFWLTWNWLDRRNNNGKGMK